MKTTLNYIAKRGIAKWMPRTQAIALYREMLERGWAKTGNSLNKGIHCFSFESHGSRTSVGYHKLDCAYANYGQKLPHPQV